MKFKDKTTKNIDIPGNTAGHQTPKLTSFLPSMTIMPQAGVGGRTPASKKLNAASARISEPTLKVAITTAVFMTPGRICLIKILGREAPATLARST